MEATHALLSIKSEDFLDYYAGIGKSPNTIRTYRAALARFVDPLDDTRTVRQVDRRILRAYVSSLHAQGKESSTIHNRWAAVKSFCQWLQVEGFLDPAP